MSFDSVALSYLPRPDGKILTRSPEILTATGKFAKVPFIVGDQEDEGTLFALFQNNLSTTADIESYLATKFFRGASPQQVQGLVATYPDNPAAGSPFGTGTDNNLYPQFKRLAAILGDATFTLTRRAALMFTNLVSPDTPSWSYLATYGQGTPLLGTFHGTDILQVFYGLPDGPVRKINHQYYFNFVYNLNPNNSTGGTTPSQTVQLIDWPRWSQGNMLLKFAADAVTLIPDDFRNESFQFLIANSQNLHI